MESKAEQLPLSSYREGLYLEPVSGKEFLFPPTRSLHVRLNRLRLRSRRLEPSGCRRASCALHRLSRSSHVAGCRVAIPFPPVAPRDKRANERKLCRRIKAMQLSSSSCMLTVSGSSVMASARQVERGSKPSATTRFIRSRSEKIPTSLPLCRTGTAPMFRSTMARTVSNTVLAELSLVDFLILDQITNTHWILPAAFRFPQKAIPGGE